MKLISMSDFVLEQEKDFNTGVIGWKEYTNNTINYAKFLKKPLELWMFTPCDRTGDVLTVGENCEEHYYQTRKKRCLFEGFEFCESQREGIEKGLKLFVSPYNSSGKIYLTKKKESGYHSWFQLFTIEDLVQCELILTAN